ncbi:unnamed protein product [Diatraea saccharalis]|uniref:CCHC-type domain-containing protein n=1 Tax=Diatraea saccharalis TaxID=40085 RepID=A0A9N9WGL4_9NEOP|nr:unnamed protein product [Diatraea saccharalis]
MNLLEMHSYPVSHRTQSARLLENSTLSLDDAFKHTRALEMARIHNNGYQQHSTSFSVNATSNFNQEQELCNFCGNKRHARRNCPASGSTCLECGKRGHLAKVCKGGALFHQKAFAAQNDTHEAKKTGCPQSLS